MERAQRREVCWLWKSLQKDTCNLGEVHIYELKETAIKELKKELKSTESLTDEN